MNHIQLQGTSLQVSEVCLGLSQIGLDNSVSGAFDLLDAFLDAGGNFLDSARIYSDWEPGEHGRSERILGDYFRLRGNRDRFVLCSKGCHPRIESMDVPRVSPQAFEEDLDATLKALGTDCIDCYLLHRDDPSVPVEVLLAAFEHARLAGKIREYGVSNWSAERIGELVRLARQSGCRGIRIDQEMVNFGCMSHNRLADPSMRVWDRQYPEVIRDARCAVMAFSGQAGGFFHQVCGGVAPQDANPFYNTPENLRRARQLKRLSDQTGLSLTALLLLYLRQAQSLQVIPIVRCQDLAELEVIKDALSHMATTVDFGGLRDFE